TSQMSRLNRLTVCSQASWSPRWQAASSSALVGEADFVDAEFLDEGMVHSCSPFSAGLSALRFAAKTSPAYPKRQFFDSAPDPGSYAAAPRSPSSIRGFHETVPDPMDDFWIPSNTWRSGWTSRARCQVAACPHLDRTAADPAPKWTPSDPAAQPLPDPAGAPHAGAARVRSLLPARAPRQEPPAQGELRVTEPERHRPGQRTAALQVMCPNPTPSWQDPGGDGNSAAASPVATAEFRTSPHQAA